MIGIAEASTTIGIIGVGGADTNVPFHLKSLILMANLEVERASQSFPTHIKILMLGVIIKVPRADTRVTIRISPLILTLSGVIQVDIEIGITDNEGRHSSRHSFGHQLVLIRVRF